MSPKFFANKTYAVRQACQLLLFLILPSILFLTNAVVWDDPYIFERHAHWSLDALFGAYAANTSSYWRPLTVLTIAVPNLIGMSIWANKLISVVLFFVEGAVTLVLLNELLHSRQSSQRSIALIAMACLVGLHPIFAEETLWISARADLLMGIFVILGVLWISRLRIRQLNEQTARSELHGFFIIFMLTWLALASKDTAIVWAGIGLVTTLAFSVNSHGAWRKFWVGSALGSSTAIVTYLILRGAVLGQVNGIPHMISRHENSTSDGLRFFTEFIVRAVVVIFAPIYDQAPFKSAGWFSDLPLFLVTGICIVCLSCTGLAVMYMGKKNKAGMYLLTCATAVILFHGALAVSFEPTAGSIISARYLAPSTLLIFVVLAMSLPWSISNQSESAGTFKSSVAITLVAVLLLQSLLLWTDVRASWSSNLALWGMSWEHQSRSRIVAENYARALYHIKDFSSERNIAKDWLTANPADPPTPTLCQLYVAVLEADIALADIDDGILYANKALPIGACRFAMAQHLSHFLLEKQCNDMLPILYQAIAEGDKPRQSANWQFRYPAQKETLQLNAAWGEAHCGDKTKAVEILQGISITNPTWRIEGDAAQKLLSGPRAPIDEKQ